MGIWQRFFSGEEGDIVFHSGILALAEKKVVIASFGGVVSNSNDDCYPAMKKYLVRLLDTESPDGVNLRFPGA